jgi:UDP-N-acetyl-D-mannosaminuronic acid dehydrogenase
MSNLGGFMKIGVVGVGHIGSVIAGELALRGNEVVAVDIDLRKIENLNKGIPPITEPGLSELILTTTSKGNLRGSNDFMDLDGSDLVLITVGTPLVNGASDLSALSAACHAVNEALRSPATIVIKSTVPPGTTRDLVAPIFTRTGFNIGFVPERLAEGQAITEFRSLPMVVGGQNLEQSHEIAQLWNKLGFETIEVGDSTAAELVKLADNAWIDLNIAFGLELAKTCDKIGTDVLAVISAANTLKKGSSYVNILLPSVGVGGYCLTKDPYFLNSFAENVGAEMKLPRIGRSVNEGAPAYLLERLIESRPLEDLGSMLVMGIAFKNNSGDTRYSPAIEFIRLTIQAGIFVTWFDPLVLDEDVPEDLISLRITHLSDKKFDVLANLAAHDGITNLEPPQIIRLLLPNGIFVDGRRFLSHVEIDEIKLTGVNYLGVGRS